MPKVNPHFSKLKSDYLFARIQKMAKHPDLIHLSIGDTAIPIDPIVSQAIEKSAHTMQKSPIGYGPSAGLPALKEALAVHVDPDEIFISDGSKSDLSGLSDLFCTSALVGAMDPGYPVFNDTHVMAGRKVHLLPCTEAHGFIPQIPKQHLDLIYLCSPGNPTGVAMTRDDLQLWVDYAIKESAIIIFDGAYEAFVQSPDVPRSIYEIPRAKKVAIELKSFSKSHGFTGLRCAYATVPKETGLHTLWKVRQNTKYNGCSYVAQQAALAALSVEPSIAIYKKNAQLFKEALGASGGIDAPYLWWKAPEGLTSWQFFEHLLERCRVVTVPGSGFGPHGEGYVRLSAFTTKAQDAIERMTAYVH